MLNLYTSIGVYMLRPDGTPLVVARGQEYMLDIHELILWSSLAFRILTYQELQKEFYEKERDLHILGERDFDFYLNRLLSRRLIASGRDDTGIDTLYDLLGHLYLKPVSNSLFTRLYAFGSLFFGKGLPLMQCLLVFRRDPLKKDERAVLHLVKEQELSTAELIQCLELGHRSIPSAKALMDYLYSDEETDCDNITIKSRFSVRQRSALTAITNLYLKQMIVFEML